MKPRDCDEYAAAVIRRFKEELLRREYRSEAQAAKKLGVKQQWLNARQQPGGTQGGLAICIGRAKHLGWTTCM